MDIKTKYNVGDSVYVLNTKTVKIEQRTVTGIGIRVDDDKSDIEIRYFTWKGNSETSLYKDSSIITDEKETFSKKEDLINYLSI